MERLVGAGTAKVLGFMLLACGAGLAQNAGSSSTPAAKLEFDVASVKPVEPRGGGISDAGGGGRGFLGGPGTADPTRIFYLDMPLKRLLMQAYGVAADQISGPESMSSAAFDIMATVPPGSTPEQVNIMLQNLLAQRFEATLHHEKRELTMYELTVAKSGSKLKESAYPDATPGKIDPKAIALDKTGFPILPPGVALQTKGSSEQDGTVRAVYRSYPIALLMQEVAGILGIFVSSEPGSGLIPARIVDKTGLTGKYDFTLKYAGRGISGNGPGISDALEKQLGLKLMKLKAPQDVIVVDHIDKVPTEN
jgi:uncharacterized protein (TIGR03435 family)